MSTLTAQPLRISPALDPERIEKTRQVVKEGARVTLDLPALITVAIEDGYAMLEEVREG